MIEGYTLLSIFSSMNTQKELCGPYKYLLAHSLIRRLTVSNIQKIGGVAAFINAAVSVATLIVAFGLIGLPALTDNSRLAELAINNPTPLIIQDVLKFVAAAVAIVLIAALHNRLQSDAPRLMRVAARFGSLAVLCLVVNASLSIFSVSQAASFAQMTSDTGQQLTGIIGLLGLSVIFLNGIWYLLISWAALRYNRLPKSLSYLGLGMGLLSLVPLLGILVLLLSIPWSLWLGQVLVTTTA